MVITNQKSMLDTNKRRDRDPNITLQIVITKEESKRRRKE